MSKFLENMTHLWKPKARDPYEYAIACAERGDVDFFKTVAPEILLKARGGSSTVLTVAAKKGLLDCCEVIVERCPLLLYHQDSIAKWSVLHWVVRYDEMNNKLENILRFLLFTADSKPDLELGGGAKIPNNRLLTMQTKWDETALYWAVQNRKHWATKMLLDADRDFDFELLRMVDRGGRTCLHFVAEEGDLLSAELILKANPDIEFLKMTAAGRSNQTALHLAVRNNNLAVAKLFLEAEHSNDLLAMIDSNQQTALHVAVHVAVKKGNLEMVKLICDADPDKQLLSMPDSQGNTPFHLAVRYNNLAVAKLFLEAEHSNDLLAMIDSNQQTALHVAAKKGNLEMVKLICDANPDKQLLSMPDSQGNTPLHFAAENSNLEMARLLIEGDMVIDYCANNSNMTPLLMAMDKAAASDGSGSDSLVICVLLLEKDPSQCTKQTGDMGWAPLHFAASYGLNRVVMDIIRLCPDCINIVNFDDQNVLHIAAYHGHLDVVQQFLGSKDTHVVALFNSQDKDGNTPLHLAVSNGNVEVVRLLLEAPQISAHITNLSEQTPYMMAMGKILSYESGECSKSDSEIIRKLLEKDPEQCKRTVDMERTYLHLATSRGHLSIIKDIIQLCPECPKLKDTHQQTFIHIAAEHGFVNVVEFILESKEIENTMLNAQDKDGNTPLHIGVHNKSQKATLCLLYDARVNKGIENDKKEKAIDLIDFPYDEAKARVYSLGHQRDLKDQSSFDLLVATLIATVSFAAGITLPGGYVSDGVNKGSAILLKATAFKVFIVSNNFALLFSLYTVFLNFSTRRLLKEEDIYYESSMGTFRTRLLLKKKDMIYQLNVATLCTLSAVYAMVVAFITGSYAVLANSDGLAITVCVSSSFFLILASHATWTMAMHYWRSKQVLKS